MRTEDINPLGNPLSPRGEGRGEGDMKARSEFAETYIGVIGKRKALTE